MKLSVKEKIGYAIAAIGDSAGYTFIGTYFLFFLTTIARVDPIRAGFISAMGVICNTIWSP